MKTSKPLLLKVAHVAKAHGIKGEIFIQPLNEKADWPDSLKEVFIGNSVFFIENYSRHKQGFIFKLKDVQTRQSAENLKDQDVFLPADIFKSQKGQEVYLTELLFFNVEFVDSKEKGIIQSFKSHSDQDFFLVKLDNKKEPVLIPFVKAYIKEICFSEKKVILSLPENFLKSFI